MIFNVNFIISVMTRINIIISVMYTRGETFLVFFVVPIVICKEQVMEVRVCVLWHQFLEEKFGLCFFLHFCFEACRCHEFKHIPPSGCNFDAKLSLFWSAFEFYGDTLFP